MSSAKKLGLWLAGYILLAVLCYVVVFPNPLWEGLFGTAFRLISDGSGWRTVTLSISEAEAYLRAPLPTDAMNVTMLANVIGDGPAIVNLQLDFEAPAASVTRFLEHFCDGVVHRRYDPFNAIHVGVPGDNVDAVFVSELYSGFYAYSPQASATTYGMRCHEESLRTILARLETRRSERTSVHFLAAGSNYGFTCLSGLCAVKPLEEFPILARGFKRDRLDNGGFELDERTEVCLELDPLTFTQMDHPWAHWLGASVSVAIDGEAIQPAYISADGRLLPASNSATPVPTPDVLRSDEGLYFNYCHREPWSIGEHNLRLSILPAQGEGVQLEWSFYRID